MATYTHFGKQADVLKHLVLCEVLLNEKPSTYVETNSACAIYPLTQTPEQQYGIYHFLEKAGKDTVLKDSTYYQLENKEMTRSHYLGSPALAMKVLEKEAQEFIFFDIEQCALENISSYTKQMGLRTPIQLIHADSREGMTKLLPSLPHSSFIHIDPYEIDKKGSTGLTYFDLLIQATQAGMKCLLWYGFMTKTDKQHLNQYMTESLRNGGITNYTCVELIMNSIEQDTIVCNSGIVGSGILATNISPQSEAIILDYSNRLVEVYRNAKYKGHDGGLYRDIPL